MKGERENINSSTLTEFLVLFQAFLIGCGIVAGVFYLIFAEFKVSNFLLAGCFIAVLLLIISIIWLGKVLVDFIHRKLKVKELTRYRNDYLIAFGTIGLFIVILRLLPYFWKLSAETFTVTFVVYLITSTSIYYFFVFQTFDKKCTWIQKEVKNCVKFVCTIILINAVLLIVNIRFALGYDNKDKTRDEITSLQHLWIVPSGIIFAEFARVWLVGVQLINVNGGRNEIVVRTVESRRVVNKISVKAEPEPLGKAVAPKATCNICSVPYTETGINIPRMLRECGHTICEQCASKLLNAKLQNLLVCPFCQKVTVVNGPAGTLPKNFALLEYRREVVQQ
ncbi:hypothetical protein CAEBREN_12876 [Caenorhabditis brenneri]|uniref:RING-type domain-containing protein n=1 Tax=Caenorhabditis brenneri TaxID=135651 RepID=G0MWU0_CAEBE|nr:hypothetical protein CAEBREN_12876 [Caenorhabditis brenneri]